MFVKYLMRLKKVVFFLVLCLVAAVVLKWGVVAGYTIPTSSMEPTLKGDRLHGDKVAVFKLHYSFFEPSRYDLVVFFRPGEFSVSPGIMERSGGMNFVKRLVGFPGETILVRNGDLYLGEAPSAPDRKPLPVVRSMLVPVYRARFNSAFFDDWQQRGPGSFEVGNNGLVCDSLIESGTGTVEGESHLIFKPVRGAIYDDYNSGNSGRLPGRNRVQDLALCLDIEFESGDGAVSGRFSKGSDEFEFTLRSEKAGGGGVVAQRFGRKNSYPVPEQAFPGFEPGKRYSIEFMDIDQRILLFVDGEVMAKFTYENDPTVAVGERFSIPGICVRNARVLFKRIDISRDIYYTNDLGTHAVGKAHEIAEGHYFFLGDNSPESEDSRSFGDISREDFVGKPFMIFYPFARFRFF